MEQNQNNYPAPAPPTKITIESLVKDFEEARMEDELNAMLNTEPPPSWIKHHKTARDEDGNPIRYLPIDKVEFILAKIFRVYQWEIISYGQIFNSVAVHGRLTVKNPFNGAIIVKDGLGAVPVQTDKGASAADMAAIKHDAVMKALPSAESYAKKDAAEHLGKIFGKDLSRRDTVPSEVFTKMAGRFNIDNPISPKNEG